MTMEDVKARLAELASRMKERTTGDNSTIAELARIELGALSLLKEICYHEQLRKESMNPPPGGNFPGAAGMKQ